MRKCMFAAGSTTKDGKQVAPDKCRDALLRKYKKIIEVCEITHSHECPLKAYKCFELNWLERRLRVDNAQTQRWGSYSMPENKVRKIHTCRKHTDWAYDCIKVGSL
jgi:hypothetical protein